MNIKECYEQMHGDYDDVMSRLVKEDRVKKFLIKFLDNTDFQETETAFMSQNWEGVFRHTHNLKGMGLNLGLAKFQELSSNLCEMTRNGEPSGDYQKAFDELKASYEETVNAITELKNS